MSLVDAVDSDLGFVRSNLHTTSVRQKMSLLEVLQLDPVDFLNTPKYTKRQKTPLMAVMDVVDKSSMTSLTMLEKSISLLEKLDKDTTIDRWTSLVDIMAAIDFPLDWQPTWFSCCKQR